MAWIAGVNIPDNKKIRYALTSIYGVGDTLSQKVLKEANIDPDAKSKDLKADEVNRIKEVVEKNYVIEGDLRREEMVTIRRLKDIGSWRGSRHSKNLPVRGQRTRTNSRSVRGNARRTIGSGRRPPPAPK